jgi:hypothetical protein
MLGIHREDRLYSKDRSIGLAPLKSCGLLNGLDRGELEGLYGLPLVARRVLPRPLEPVASTTRRRSGETDYRAPMGRRGCGGS